MSFLLFTDSHLHFIGSNDENAKSDSYSEKNITGLRQKRVYRKKIKTNFTLFHLFRYIL